MFKKSLATALLVCTIPAMANAAWFLTTQVKSAGGTLTTGNGSQVVTDGVITKSYTDLTSQSAATAVDAGYTLRYLTISDSSVDGTVPVAGSSFNPVDGHTYTVAAAFKVNSLAVTASNAGGTVTPSSVGSIFYGYKLPYDLTFTFSPKTGYTITDINNVPASALVVKTLPSGTVKVNKRATVTFKAGYVFTAAVNLQAVTINDTPALNQILPQTVVAGSATSITAGVTNVSSPVYAWSYVSGPKNTVSYTTVNGKVSTVVTPGPAVVLTGADTNKISFTAPADPGQYKFQVQVGSMVKLATVNVVATAADSANQCQFCHTANKIDDATIGARYGASIHGQSTHSACSACHYGTANGGHPGSVSAKTVDKQTFAATVDNVVGANGTVINKGGIFCATCHTGAYPIPHPVDAVPPSPAAGLGTKCIDCHTAGGDAHDIQGLAVKLTPAVGDACILCHDNRNTSFKTSVHFSANGQNTKNECMFCHGFDGTTPTTAHGKAPSCDKCHASGTNEAFDTNGATCATCHSGGGHPHSIKTTAAAGLKKKCVECHSVEIQHPGDFVKDNNNGVRAVVAEFSKWSHHIVNANGAAPIDEQCAACHLEGTVDANNNFVVDSAKHMADAKTHLRNADSDADIAWDPAAPVHSDMDTFCMSCHDANGATSTISKKLQALITPKTGITASPKNPFGDTISNRYDKMMRPAVTNVDDQFNTNNNSHHGVKGPRYSGRTRAAGPRQIKSATTFANNSSALLQGTRSTIYDAGNFNALYVPLADVNGEAAPRTGAQSLGDDSTLHCGDCHTVGQWAKAVATNAKGELNTVAIGAHGSNNEYMLRNSIGTDERHTQNAYTQAADKSVTYTNPNGAFLVCYNCHTYTKYGSIFNNTAMGTANKPELGGAHAGEYANSNRCNGPGNTLAFNGYTTGTASDGTQFAGRIEANKVPTVPAFAAGFPLNGSAPAAGEQKSPYGNVFGIQCLNCHNSGLGNGYGGIHGSANDTDWNDNTTAQGLLTAAGVTPATKGFYVDGMGNATKVERFLPGLGNAMYVPGTLGGFNGGTTVNGKIAGGVSNDTNWEQKHGAQTANTVFNYAANTVSNTLSAGAGCYTLGAGGVVDAKIQEGASVKGPNGAASELEGTWGACEDHKGAQGSGTSMYKRIVRPVTY